MKRMIATIKSVSGDVFVPRDILKNIYKIINGCIKEGFLLHSHFNYCLLSAAVIMR